MKIVIIGPAFPLRGGIADFNEALSKAFTANGDQVSIYSFYFQYPKFLFPGTSQVTAGDPPEQLIIRTTLSSVNPFSWWKTARLIREEKPDLVLVRYWLPFMAPALGTVCRLIRKRKIPVIAITDNVIPHESRIGDSAFTSYFVKSCDGFVTMSRAVLDDLKKFTATDKKTFLPHPIYSIFGKLKSKTEARKNLDFEQGRKIILFFGFIRAYKGLDLLIEAMADPRIRQHNVQLIVAGEFYEDAKPYFEKVKALDLESDIIFKQEFIPKEMVADYFCAADIIVQPYKHATQSGITQIAYHFERPMLVTNVGGLAEIVFDGKTGYVTDTNAISIANAIDDFYSANKEAELSKNVKIESVRFSWEAFVEGIINLYRLVNK